jgi:hypothetical protein
MIVIHSAQGLCLFWQPGYVLEYNHLLMQVGACIETTSEGLIAW